MPCRVENKAGLLQWTRDGFGLGDSRDLVGYTRYSLVDSDDESKKKSLYFKLKNFVYKEIGKEIRQR